MANPKLNQIIAVANGKKNQAQAVLTALYQQEQKGDLFNGLFRRYKPSDDDGETLPDEQKLPQLNSKDLIVKAQEALTELINVVATQDNANMNARADVVVDGKVILQNVPVTHLLFLEKRLEDVIAFVGKLPTLDAGERWEFDASQDMFKTAPYYVNRNLKKPRNHVRYEATKEHPAQVDVIMEEVKIGQYEATKFSTAVEARRKNEMLTRIAKLREAVKFARETANNIDAPSVDYATGFLGYIFS